MIELEIQFDKDKYQDIIARCVLFGKDVDKAINRAARRAGDAGKTETKRQLADEYTLPSSAIGKTLEVIPLAEGATMRIFSSVQDLMEFKGVKQKSKAVPGTGRNLVDVSIEIKKGNVFSGDRRFAGYMQVGQKTIGVYRQDESRRNVFRRYIGPSTVGMFKANETVHNAALEKIMETLDKRMTHELERLLNG